MNSLTIKKVLMSFFLIISYMSINGQNPNWLWAKSAGGIDYDIGSGISVDTSGNVYLTGNFQSPTIAFGTTILTNSSYCNFFIVKYDPNGNILWAKSTSSNGNASGRHISTDASGNIYVTGNFSGDSINFDSTCLTNSGIFSDIFVVKYNPNGDVLWAISVGGNDSDEGHSISVDANGNIYITGCFESDSISLGTNTLYNSGNGSDIIIVKYDSNGNLLWAKSAGESGRDEGESIASDVYGNVYVTGYFESLSITFGTTTLTNSGPSSHSDIFIVKYDTSGNLLWAKSAGGTDSDISYGISTDTGGNALITGYFMSPSITFGTITLTNAGIFIVKYSYNGDVLWANSSEGSNSIEGEGLGISTDPFGNVLAAGYFNSSSISFGLDTLTNAGFPSCDIFIVKYDALGNVKWAKSVGGSTYDMGYGVSTDLSGNTYITGYFMSPTITFGNSTLTNSNNYSDIFVAKLNLSTCISDDVKPKNLLGIFPNPVSHFVTIHTGVITKKGCMTIYDIHGQEVKQVNDITGQTVTICCSDLPDGMYFIRLREKNCVTASGKFIISN